MNKSVFTTMMMEMCMQYCCMCMTFCASVSDMISISKAKYFAA